MANKKPAIPEIRRATRGAVAEFFGVALTTVDGWVRKGCPVVKHGSKGIAAQYDLKAVAEWFYKGQTDAVTDPEKLAPQDRKAWYDAEKRKRDLEVEAGELVPRAELEQAVATAFAAVTQDLLAIPDQLERLHAVPADVAAKVDAGVCAAVEALRARMARLAPEAVSA